jgi:transposase
MLKNRVHSLLHRRGILTPSGDLFVGAGRRFLDQLQLDEAGRTILDRYLARIDDIAQTVEESTVSLRTLAREPRWARKAALLQTMPGVGLITAMTILAELGDLTRFRSRAAVANYAGLVPRQRSSNQKHWSGGIAKHGPSHLRGALIEAAWISIRRVPVYIALYDRVERKAGARTAIVAVGRRLLEDAWTLLQKDEPFRYVPMPIRLTDSRIGQQVDSSVAG